MASDRQFWQQADDELCWLPIPEAARGLRRRQFSSLELTDALLDRIARWDALVGSYITVDSELARADARQADLQLGRGLDLGPLHGIPIGLKDVLDMAGIRTTAGSRLLRDRVPLRDATVVRRLRRAGCVVLGKQALTEFATGAAHNPTFGITRNPWSLERVPGGSSSGSAAAVASGFALGAIGTDTTGSVRQPAALCGLVGIRPSHGSVPLGGVIGLSRSFDTLGPIARTVEGAASLLTAMGSGAALHLGASPYHPSLGGLRIAVAVGEPWRDVDASVQAAVDDALAELERLGARIEPVDLGDVAGPVEARRRVQYAEAARLHAGWLADQRDLYDPTVLALLDFGRSVDATAEACARRELRRFRARVRNRLPPGALLVTPTTPAAAWEFGDARMIGGLPMRIAGFRLTAPLTAAGLAAMSVPCGAEADGRPIGLQLACPPGQEARMIAAAAAYEQRTDWWRRHPVLPPALTPPPA